MNDISMELGHFSTLLNESESFVRLLLHRKIPANYVYHNISHTEDVVRNAKQISSHLELSPRSNALLLVSAWFHDTGFVKSYRNHEKQSIEIARDFLKDKIGSDFISEISLCIEATKVPQQPKSFEAELLCDADMLHLGRQDFLEKSLRLREEWIDVLDEHQTYENFVQTSLQFLKNHHFFSVYAQENFNKGKELNQRKLEDIIEGNTEKSRFKAG